MTYLIDTNVLSELRKPDRADRAVLRWADRMEAAEHFISCMTVFEAEYGALLIERRDATQGALMRRWVERDIIRRFAGRILPVDETVALRCAALHVPDPRPERDALIAATALVHDLTVATRNTRDFAGTGVRLFNPWDA